MDQVSRLFCHELPFCDQRLEECRTLHEHLYLPRAACRPIDLQVVLRDTTNGHQIEYARSMTWLGMFRSQHRHPLDLDRSSHTTTSDHEAAVASSRHSVHRRACPNFCDQVRSKTCYPCGQARRNLRTMRHQSQRVSLFVVQD